MPNTIALSAFVIGLVLVIAALLGTKVKIVQVELPELAGPKRAAMDVSYTPARLLSVRARQVTS